MPDDNRRLVKLEGQHRVDRHVMAGLARALDWFDNSLQNVLASRGFKSLHRTQSMIMLHIASGIESPAEIAREMNLTRQNVHHMAKSLIADGLIEQAPDPTDPRRTVYHLSGRAADIRNAALEAMTSLETVLANRIGDRAVNELRKALARDWGAEIQNQDELAAGMGERSGAGH